MRRRIPGVVPRFIQFHMDDDLYPLFAEYHKARELDQTLGDTVRELMKIALASTPEAIQLSEARNRGLSQTRSWALDRLETFFAELKKELEVINKSG